MTRQSHKSTNVRISLLAVFLRGVAAVCPGLAARFLEKLFLRTRRHPVPNREAEWLAGARPSSFESRGQRLAAWTWGESIAPTVLLAHGWEGRGSQMGAFVAPLVASGFRVIAFDAPGHGLSNGRTSSLVEMADAVGDAASAYGPLHAVIAHSAGAAATAVALSRGVQLTRAVFVAPPADLGAFLQTVAGTLGLPEEIAAITRRRIEKRFGIDWDKLRAEHVAPEMKIPILVIHDEGDREVRLDDGIRLAGAWPGAHLMTTTGLGHRRVLRDPVVVDRAVAFVRNGEGALGPRPILQASRAAVVSAREASAAGSTSASTTRSLPPSLAR